jgi:hypothetical protein
MKVISAIIFLGVLASTYALELDLKGKGYTSKNPILTPMRAGMPIPSMTDTTQPEGLTVLRKKQPDGRYGLFQGRLQKDAWQNVSAFHPQALNAWNLLLHARFFADSPKDSSTEIQEIYWIGSVLLVPADMDTLYAQTPEGTSVMLAIAGQPVTIQVESEPRAAVVSVMGKPTGTTPTQFQWLDGNLVQLRIDKLGLFSSEDIIEADPNEPTVISYKLRERPTFQDGSPVDTLAFAAHGTKDYLEVEAMLSRITSTQITGATTRAVEWITAYLDTLKTRQYVEYIGPQNLSLAPWDAKQAGIPIRLWYAANDFDFGFEGLLPCSYEESVNLTELLKPVKKSASLKSSQRVRRTSWPSAHTTANLDGWIRLKYRNWATDTRASSRNVHRYFAMDELELVLPDQVIKLPGNFIPATYIQQSDDWKEFIEAQQ